MLQYLVNIGVTAVLILFGVWVAQEWWDAYQAHTFVEDVLPSEDPLWTQLPSASWIDFFRNNRTLMIGTVLIVGGAMGWTCWLTYHPPAKLDQPEPPYYNTSSAARDASSHEPDAQRDAGTSTPLSITPDSLRSLHPPETGPKRPDTSWGRMRQQTGDQLDQLRRQVRDPLMESPNRVFRRDSHP